MSYVGILEYTEAQIFADHKSRIAMGADDADPRTIIVINQHQFLNVFANSIWKYAMSCLSETKVKAKATSRYMANQLCRLRMVVLANPGVLSAV